MPPLTKAWCAENPERYRDLVRPPSECPICTEAFTEDTPALSPIQGDRVSSCTHWACSNCWLAVMEYHPAQWRCPFCRECLQTWLGETMAEHGYAPPADAVDVKDVRRLASEMLRLDTSLELQQLARRILRHTPAE